MNCETARQLLSEYVDGTLSARNVFRVECHLAACHTCAALAHDLRRTVGAVSRLPAIAAPEGFAERLARRLQSVEPAPRRRAWVASLVEVLRPRLVPAMGALGACAVLAALLLLPRPSPGPPPASEAEQQAATHRLQSVVLSATDPFEDLAAANLAAHASTAEQTAGRVQ